MEYLLPQDLHIHTVFSKNDSSVCPEQTVELVAFAKHSKIIGISDHLDCFMPDQFEVYQKALHAYGIHVGVEVNGHKEVDMAIEFDFEYYIYHCWGHVGADYTGLKKLQATSKPVIVAHPYAIETDLHRIEAGSIVEINNRYIWRYNWREFLQPYVDKFRWVFSSDAHQPNWLNQQMARRVGQAMHIDETILF